MSLLSRLRTKAKIMVGPEDSGRIIGWMKDFWPPK